MIPYRRPVQLFTEDKRKETRMIFGNIRNLKDYLCMEDGVFECFNYAKRNDLKTGGMRSTAKGSLLIL